MPKFLAALAPGTEEINILRFVFSPRWRKHEFVFFWNPSITTIISIHKRSKFCSRMEIIVSVNPWKRLFEVGITMEILKCLFLLSFIIKPCNKTLILPFTIHKRTCQTNEAHPGQSPGFRSGIPRIHFHPRL